MTLTNTLGVDASPVVTAEASTAEHRLELLRARLTAANSGLVTQCAAAKTALDAALEALDRAEAERAFARIMDLIDRRRFMRDLTNLTGGTAPPLYVVSTLFLEESFRFLVRHPSEDMHYVTGSELGPWRVLERLVDFEKSTRTAVGVSGTPSATHRTLIGLSEKAHRLIAWCHSHPGRGAGATLPSGIDLDHQERLERGGYPTIGLIFSRDGYVRFFSHTTTFRLQVFGAGVRSIDERVYQLQLD